MSTSFVKERGRDSNPRLFDPHSSNVCLTFHGVFLVELRERAKHSASERPEGRGQREELRQECDQRRHVGA